MVWCICMWTMWSRELYNMSLASINATGIASLTSLQFFDVAFSPEMVDTFVLPPSLQDVSFERTNLVQPFALPARVTAFTWYLNTRATALHDVDWTSVQNLELNNVTTFRNVSLSSRLELFVCPECNMTTCIMDNATFNAVNAVPPKPRSGRAQVDISISTSATDCTAQNGVLRKLWNTDNTTCVVAAATLPPSTTLAPQATKSQWELIFGVTAAVLAASLLLALFIYRRLQRQTLDTSVGSDTALTDELHQLELYKINPLALSTTSKKPLAAGAFGEVWRGTYNEGPVAIKRNKNKDPVSVQHFIAEISLMAKMESPYIVKLVGASWTRPIDIEAVVEYMDLGDLRTYLATHTATQFPWSDKALCVQSIVFGLVYLHTFDPPIIHRDLKSKNILLDAHRRGVADVHEILLLHHIMAGRCVHAELDEHSTYDI
ncbi:TKL protein kinase, variant 1 [Saprolegnia diclina VS20]|uniref:TKL protein kinase, variant 1 n=1 Tax=Saprolegnia diclina (strain VS20) TaxID=1156394 RepID=T0PQ96_SAPDV|nr:TKL protein kinase, variant 1 [Saprolegnia diclina VS20]EQC27654.1 TKL protein kinase, variant 1 [Saprolegnia diclina VS20]|eukprot:XP_008618921.1 TKL protein kinase, variant 1 [Saprolegnia diclina VS20]